MAQRKLQAEMDRTYKRITEGIENFQDIESKMNAASSAAQKEKYEADLKTQIKKLQRLRDQLKTWQAGSEVKDKGPVSEHRKLIEVQMERFKVIEKEMKTKAYSKEALLSSNRLDAKEQARLDLQQWLSDKVEELQRQVESTEAEIESAQAGKKKGKAGEAVQARVELLELQNERRQWHISQLEIILRLVENSSLKVEDVEAVKDDVDFFVQMNAEEDYDYDEGVYAELNLENYVDVDPEGENDDESEAEPEELPPRTPLKKTPVKHDDDEKDDHAASKRSVPRPRARSIAKPLEPLPTAPKPPIPTPNFSVQSMATAVKGGSNPAPAPAPRMPLRYAAAAAAAAGPSSSAVVSTPVTIHATPTPPAPAPSQPAPSQSLPVPQQATPATVHSTTTPVSDNATPLSPSVQADSSVIESPLVVTAPKPTTAPEAQKVDNATSAALNSPVASFAEAASPIALKAQPSQDTAATTSAPSQAVITPPPGLGASATPIREPSAESGHGVIGSGLPAQANGLSPAPLQQQPKTIGTLTDLVSTFQNVQRKAYQRLGDTEQIHGMLDAMSSTAPQLRDAEKPRYHAPRNPMQTPPYYPQSLPPVFSSPEIYKQVELETLFWVFYYMPGTYQQWLASQELKRQSWRFHVKFLTWFQRLTKPEEITEEYELGHYLYFDWEGSWCVRRKASFRFEYRCMTED